VLCRAPPSRNPSAIAAREQKLGRAVIDRPRAILLASRCRRPRRRVAALNGAPAPPATKSRGKELAAARTVLMDSSAAGSGPKAPRSRQLA
jgi:hypothetical protein